MEIKKTPQADLEKNKNMYFLAGLALSMSVTLLAFEWRIFDVYEIPCAFTLNTEEIEELPPIYFAQSPPPPSNPKIELKIVDELDLPETVDVPTSESNSNSTYVIQAPSIELPVEPIDPEPQIYVDEIPSFPGGITNMYTYLNEHLVYPKFAKENNIRGKVFIRFVVWHDGSIRNISVVKGIGFGCDEETMRVVQSMPKWIPGKQQGKPVSVWFNLPVVFSLRD